MNERYLHLYRSGMLEQLRELTLDETVLYIRNHIHNFFLDESVCFTFIERLAGDPDTAGHDKAGRALLYLLDKGVQLRPFRAGVLAAAVQRTRNPLLRHRLDLIGQHNHSSEIYDQISALNLKEHAEDARTFLEQLIRAHPDHIAAAQYALSVDRHLGIAHGQWQDVFTCPPALRRDWNIHLFNHYATLSEYDRAMDLWPKLKPDMLRETSLNLAAEMFVARGDTSTGLELYRASLAQDPRQTPARLRMRELENPFVPNAELPKKCSVSICLYSWNKGELLGQTLKGLSLSAIGTARIHILLNGCTDNSREIVNESLALFPDNEVVIHDLHVNIGAPAARNWLLGLPEVQVSDYVAFLDDDVTVSEDWLASFLTIAEADPTVGVVGCKVLHPETPAMYQYLFRHVAIAGYGLLRMSLHAPVGGYDNHAYDFIRETRNVMGCLHLLRTEAVRNISAGFDIRFSPSQVDDIDHDIAVCLEGYKVMYCGTTACIHHQSSGETFGRPHHDNTVSDHAMANDIKFFFKHADRLDTLQGLDSLSLDLGVELPVF